MINVFSSGGAGDFLIVYLKIKNLLEEQPYEKIHWKHIESNNIVPKLFEDVMRNSFLKDERIEVEGICDPYYTPDKIIKEYNDFDGSKLLLNTRQNGDCPFYGKGRPVFNPFLDIEKCQIEHWDICLQYSGGAKGSREWKFFPNDLVSLLRRKGYKVAMIGVQNHKEIYFPYINEHQDDFIDKLTLSQTMEVIHQSGLIISLSGFISYFSLAMKIPNIRVVESEHHNDHYIHPEYKQFDYQIQYGSMKEVIDGLKHYGFKV